MAEATYNEYFHARLSQKDFVRLGSFIQSSIGIKMPQNKIIMLEARLRKRLRNLQLSSYTEYCDYLFSPAGMKDEVENLIDAITTNKTEFFREPDHFGCLTGLVLPELLNGSRWKVSVWSAASSTGEEPYSLAMVLEEYARHHPERRFDYDILATDISVEVLAYGKSGIYDEKRVSPVPMDLKKRYFLRSRDRSRSLVRIVPELRRKVIFQLLNLMDDDYGFDRKMDIIFCRNVIIYFDRSTQEGLLNRLCRCLKPGGYIFMGHSEVLAGLNLPLESVAPTVYKKTG